MERELVEVPPQVHHHNHLRPGHWELGTGHDPSPPPGAQSGRETAREETYPMALGTAACLAISLLLRPALQLAQSLLCLSSGLLQHQNEQSHCVPEVPWEQLHGGEGRAEESGLDLEDKLEETGRNGTWGVGAMAS